MSDYKRNLFYFSPLGLKCSECGYNCHDKCEKQAPWQCKKPELPEQPGSVMTKSTMSIPSEVRSCF